MKQQGEEYINKCIDNYLNNKKRRMCDKLGASQIRENN
jgi:hypothetical protein